MTEWSGEPKRYPIALREPGELERVHDAEIVEDDKPDWEALISEWSDAGARVFAQQLRQARAAAAVHRHYGESSMEAFAHEVGVSRSTVYDYARAFWTFGHLYFSDDGEPSARLENPGTTTISRLIQDSYAEDPMQALEESESEDLSTREQKARRKERETPRNVETIQRGTCPHCGAVFEARDADLRSEAV